ncbi:MAG: type II secretion system GspH family protein [Clostridia bacterium]|nr:type II secretion system GspH family protein [Clostridia bacterium]
MKRVFKMRKNKRGFTLMEVVIALAVVGLICALILPLTSSAMASFNAAQEMRNVASTANKEMATSKYATDSSSEKRKKDLYVTVRFDELAIKSESKLKFSQTGASESKYGSTVTYYDLEQINVTGMGETKS